MAKTYKAVKYNGTSHERIISKADWEKVGVEHESLKWNRDAPGNTIPLSEITLDDEAFAQYITADPDFEVIDVEVEDRPTDESE